MPSTCCPTYVSTKLLLTGAVLYGRVSRAWKSGTSGHGASASRLAWCTFGALAARPSHHPPVSPSPWGDTPHGYHRPTSRQERPASLPCPGATQGRTTPLRHFHQAL